MTDNQNQSDFRNGRRGRNPKSQYLMGLGFLIVAALLLAQKMIPDFPSWVFSWPMILIGVGIFTAIKHNFKNPSAYILILVGSIFLFDRMSDEIYLRPYFWPIAFFVGGIYFLLRPKNKWNRSFGGDTKPDGYTDYEEVPSGDTPAGNKSYADKDDMLDITAVFGGVKRRVLSKDFKGGEIVAVFGGCEVNLLQADFSGKIRLEVFNMFGGTKLVIPPDWNVQSEVVAIMGGVEDKRPPANNYDPSKVIMLEGTCLMGGLEIKSF